MGDLDVKSLVIYEDSEVIGVKEFHVAKALLEGQQEGLSALVPSQWGSVHLFDLCLLFGYIDTPLALALHGVEGCKLEKHHLGELPDARGAETFSSCYVCRCEGGNTCSRCCWGFPVDNGMWMNDRDANLWDAAKAAEKAAKTPLVKGILEICSRTEELPFTMSDEVATRLLDVAILSGNCQAAANLAKTCRVRPLRRWRGDAFSFSHLPVLSAGLLAGANFQDLRPKYFHEDGKDSVYAEVPLLLQVALAFHSEDWQQLGHFFSLEPRWPTEDLELGPLFLDYDRSNDGSISMQKVQNALRSGWNLERIWVGLLDGDVDQKAYLGLLELAILCGNPSCADALATAGVELREDCLEWLQRACRGESVVLRLDAYDSEYLLVGSASECKSAASAAARASLRRSFKCEGVERGVAVYQTFTKKFHPRGVDRALVHHILSLSMDIPEILDQLDLWDEVRDWLPPSLEVKAYGNVETLQMDLAEELSGFEAVGKPGPASEEPPEADVKSTDDLMTALQLSRDQVPVLNMDGVCVFRLTRMATSEHVAKVLWDATGPLAALHTRVLEAGCEVDPEWNPVKALFVPMDQSQMNELQALSEHGYELSREDHILALQSDRELITEALRQICHKNRPKLKKVGPEVTVPTDAQQDEDMDADDEPLLVLESGIRTNSSLGFPSYPSSAW